MRGGTELLLAAGTCSVQVHILADDLVRVRYLREGALRPDLSWAVVKRDWPAVTTDITDSPGSLTVKTRTLDIVITKKPLRISFRDRAGDLICEDLPSKGMSWNGSPRGGAD
jgi:hypothetical protein